MRTRDPVDPLPFAYKIVPATGIEGGARLSRELRAHGRRRRVLGRGLFGASPDLLDVVDREQVLVERSLDPRSVRAILAGEVGLERHHSAAHLQMLAQIRGPGVHLPATRANVQARPHDRE